MQVSSVWALAGAVFCSGQGSSTCVQGKRRWNWTGHYYGEVYEGGGIWMRRFNMDELCQSVKLKCKCHDLVGWVIQKVTFWLVKRCYRLFAGISKVKAPDFKGLKDAFREEGTKGRNHLFVCFLEDLWFNDWNRALRWDHRFYVPFISKKMYTLFSERDVF